MKPQPFEDFLKEKHGELFPTLLDDDMPDHFDNWLGTLDGEDYIRYADEYGAARYLTGFEHAKEMAVEVITTYNLHA